MKSDAKTADDYLAGLPEDRQEAIQSVRNKILEKLPEGYVESMRWGMITYEVPLSICPDTYNGEPLMYAALASQKRHMAVYMTGIYIVPEMSAQFVQDWKARGTRLDMGKNCVRFKKLEQVELDLVGEVIEALPMDKFVGLMQKTNPSKKK